MHEVLRRAAAHLVVDDLDTPRVDAADVHHVARVLRVRDGEQITMTDGSGHWRAYRWRGPTIDPEPDGPIQTAPRREPRITIGFAPVKGDRPEWVVAKLTELGVDTIIPLRAQRSVVVWEGERIASNISRLQRVARESVMQSRRCEIPRIETVHTVNAVPDAALADFGGGALTLDHPAVCIGPEGGWADDEIEGRATVELGPLVLRAETAAVAAAVTLTTLRGRGIPDREGGRL